MSANNQLSFLPDDYLDLKNQRRTNLLWAMLFIVVAVGIGLAYYYAENRVREEEERNAKVGQEFTDAAATMAEFTQLQQTQKVLDQKAKLAGSLVENVQRTEILAELTNLLPESVTLSDVTMESKRVQKNTAPLTAQDRARLVKATQDGAGLPDPISYEMTLKLRGLAPDDLKVAQYLKNLSDSALFSDVGSAVATEEFKEPAGADGKTASVDLRRFEVKMMLNQQADTRLSTTRPATGSTTAPTTGSTKNVAGAK